MSRHPMVVGDLHIYSLNREQTKYQGPTSGLAPWPLHSSPVPSTRLVGGGGVVLQSVFRRYLDVT